MPTITNTAPRVFNLPRLEPTAADTAKLTKQEVESLAGHDETGAATPMAPWGPVTLGPPPPAVGDPNGEALPKFPNSVEISTGHLKLLRTLFKVSFDSALEQGLRVGP